MYLYLYSLCLPRPGDFRGRKTCLFFFFLGRKNRKVIRQTCYLMDPPRYARLPVLFALCFGDGGVFICLWHVIRNCCQGAGKQNKTSRKQHGRTQKLRGRHTDKINCRETHKQNDIASILHCPSTGDSVLLRARVKFDFVAILSACHAKQNTGDKIVRKKKKKKKKVKRKRIAAGYQSLIARCHAILSPTPTAICLTGFIALRYHYPCSILMPFVHFLVNHINVIMGCAPSGRRSVGAGRIIRGEF